MKKVQYSKLLPIASAIIFIVCLYMGYTADFSTMIDASFYVTAISLSGGLCATTTIWYMKKAQSENTVKLKTELYKVASDERYKYNEKMIMLKHKYALSNEDIEDIETDSPMDDFEQDALSDIESTIDEVQSDADSAIELQTF